MKMTAYVMEDSEGSFDDNKTGEKVKFRSIVVLDQESGEGRLLQPVKLSIRSGDALAGEPGSLRDAVVELAIVRIEQNEKSKDLKIRGHVLAVKGMMSFKASAPVKAETEGKKAA